MNDTPDSNGEGDPDTPPSEEDPDVSHKSLEEPPAGVISGDNDPDKMSEK